ncbi:MAG TPA: low affinity iron permease family protein [Alphaproteobacteria bacterium]
MFRKRNKPQTPDRNFFMLFANKASDWTGSPQAFITAVSIIVIWAVSGPLFGYSDTWQLVINTGTTIVTFLMVFLIQNTQNRDSKALQLKLDELIRVTPGAHVRLLDMEELSDKDLKHLRDKYEKIAREARKRIKEGDSDTDIPDVVLED